jgi:hypothetical protein
MTVATAYFNYQRAGTSNPLYAKGEAPAIETLQQYMLKRWSGQDLGSYGIRPVVGGKSLSTHSFGAAWDWRYENPGIGRAQMLNQVMPFLIDYSKELGIQYIGDYVGCRIWKADRSGDVNGGWKIQPVSSQMGQSWARWLHIEVHPDEWADGAPVEDKIGIGSSLPVPVPPFVPEYGQFSLWPLNPAKPTLRVGSVGDPVRYLQGVLRKGGFGISIDGQFGDITTNFVRFYQGICGLLADGIVGPKTWAFVDQDAVK